MKTFGDEARDLAYDISERESDLRILTEFQEKGGQFRLSVSCNHPDSYVQSVIQRLGCDGFMLNTVMTYMVKQASIEVTNAKNKLRMHMITNGAAPAEEKRP